MEHLWLGWVWEKCIEMWDHMLVGGLEHFIFFYLLGMSSSQLTKSIIFQRGRLNHQPVWDYVKILRWNSYTTNHLLMISVPPHRISLDPPNLAESPTARNMGTPKHWSTMRVPLRQTQFTLLLGLCQFFQWLVSICVLEYIGIGPLAVQKRIPVNL